MVSTWTMQVGSQQWQGVEAVLFDKDGTIADTWAFLTRLGQARIAAIAHRCPGIETALCPAWGITAAGEVDPAGALAVESRSQNIASVVEVLIAGGIADKIAGDRPHLHIQVMQWIQGADQTLGAKAPQTPLYADAAAAIARFTAAGIPLGIVSADTPEQVQDFVAHYDLRGAIGVALGSTRTLAKPNADFLQAVCAALGVSPAATVVVGDAASDVALARSGGARCVLVQRRSPPASACIHGADCIITSLDALKVLAQDSPATKVV